METKFALTSRTIIGALMVLSAPFINKYLGVHIDAVMQGEVTDALEGLMIQIGAVLAIYGRIKATKTLKLL